MSPLQHWTTIIKLVIKFMTCFKWRRQSLLRMGTKSPLCEYNTSCFSKEQHCFYALFYSLSLSAILSRLAHAHEEDECDTSALGKSKY
jgi:hypothetical protein